MSLKQTLLAGAALTLLAAAPVWSAEAADSPGATQTDIVGSKEAPSVFNIVPWKDKSMDTNKQRTVNTSILRETLQPLDREVLQREVQLQESLSRE